MSYHKQKTIELVYTPTLDGVPPELLWWMQTPTDEVFNHFAAHVVKADSDMEHHAYIDNGADVLAVAHLDTVQKLTGVTAHAFDPETGDEYVKATGLDDRLGAYAITHLLPFPVDLLFTDHEEIGSSTASAFTPPTDKKYRYVLEFDRAGIDVVTYSIDSPAWLKLLRSAGATVGTGSYTDLCYLAQEHMPMCMVNYGTGYYRAHDKDSYANLTQLHKMVELAKAVHAKATASDAPAQWLADNNWARNRPMTYTHSGYSYSGGYSGGYGRSRTRPYQLTNAIAEARKDVEAYRAGCYVSAKFDAKFIRYCAACGLRLFDTDRHAASCEWPFCVDCSTDLEDIAGFQMVAGVEHGDDADTNGA